MNDLRLPALLVYQLMWVWVPAVAAADAVMPTANPPTTPMPDSVAKHLERARACMAKGDYASAKIEFETVLRFDNLPDDLHQQVDIYARMAQEYEQGNRLLPNAYLMLGGGNYKVNPTEGTDAFGGSDTDDNFVKFRMGAGLNYVLGDGYALDGTVDYRYRDYADRNAEYESARRDDKDLRWNGAISRSMGDLNAAVGVRGRASYRGDGDYRHDYGVYGSVRYALNPTNQLNIGAEFRRREYPSGSLRVRSRNIAALTGGWTHAFWDGKASMNLATSLGREIATDGRPDGDSNFLGLSPTLSLSLTDTLGGYIFGAWQQQRYQTARNNLDADGHTLSFAQRTDNKYEAGAGLTWAFLPSWSLNPEILYIRDDSNFLSANYSSTELWMMLRKDF